MARTVRILREADVRGALDMASCIEACQEAFIAYSSGEAELPGVIHLDVPEAKGEIHIKAGHIHGAPFYAVKASSGFTGVDPSLNDGMVVVFDARDGAPAAFLLDNGYITDLRTGAAGGVAARYLAPADARRVAVIGTGAQVAWQVGGLILERPDVRDVRVWGRDTRRAERCADGLRTGFERALPVDVAPTVREAVEGADVVITCTAARQPLVERAWLRPGAHVTAVGSDGPGKQELDPAILRDADVLVVDSRDQCERLGELQHASDLAAGAIELGQICAGEERGRTREDQLTVCDLTGLGVQDVAAALVVMQRATERGDVLSL